MLEDDAAVRARARRSAGPRPGSRPARPAESRRPGRAGCSCRSRSGPSSATNSRSRTASDTSSSASTGRPRAGRYAWLTRSIDDLRAVMRLHARLGPDALLPTPCARDRYLRRRSRFLASSISDRSTCFGLICDRVSATRRARPPRRSRFCTVVDSGPRVGRMVEILLGEGEVEVLLRQLGDGGGDVERRVAVLRVEEPAHRADMVLEEIDQRRPVRRDHVGPHRPHHRLGRPDRVARR